MAAPAPARAAGRATALTSHKNALRILPPTHIFSFSYFRASRQGFPLYATARNAIRAVCIADEIFERLEQKGIEIHFEFHDRTGLTMHAVKDGERLQFQFREPVKLTKPKIINAFNF